MIAPSYPRARIGIQQLDNRGTRALVRITSPDPAVAQRPAD
jgi:hypothetical protein